MRPMIVLSLAVLALLLALATTACMPDLTGLEEASAYAGEALAHGEVAEIVCASDAVERGTYIQCQARGHLGQVLAHSDISLVLWSASDPDVLQVMLDGRVYGHEAGTADVVAEGPNGSRATFTLTVEE